LGENTTRTVQAVLGARVVLPDTQSNAPPVWTAKSALSDVTLIAPLVCWPLFRIVKPSALLDWPVVTEPKSRLAGETERLADDPQEPAAQVPPVEHVAPLATQVSTTQQPPPVQAEVPQGTPDASEAASTGTAPLESGVAGGKSGVPASTGRTLAAVYGAVGGIKSLVQTARPLTTRSSSM
jgi:hypothetical protein